MSDSMMPAPWSFAEALGLLKITEPVAKTCGCHLGLCGSVLHSGESDDDLDIVVFPLKTDQGFRWDLMRVELGKLGFDEWEYVTPYHVGDTKQVFSSYYCGRRVDWFLLDMPGAAIQ